MATARRRADRVTQATASMVCEYDPELMSDEVRFEDGRGVLA